MLTSNVEIRGSITKQLVGYIDLFYILRPNVARMMKQCGSHSAPIWGPSAYPGIIPSTSLRSFLNIKVRISKHENLEFSDTDIINCSRAVEFKYTKNIKGFKIFFHSENLTNIDIRYDKALGLRSSLLSGKLRPGVTAK